MSAGVKTGHYSDGACSYCSVTAHHKSDESLAHRNPILRWYYSIYPLFGYCCVGTEMFYVLLYVLHFHQSALIHQVRAQR